MMIKVNLLTINIDLSSLSRVANLGEVQKKKKAPNQV
jgi:hypothetical protein